MAEEEQREREREEGRKENNKQASKLVQPKPKREAKIYTMKNETEQRKKVLVFLVRIFWWVFCTYTSVVAYI